MALTTIVPGGDKGALNGVNWQVIVPAPAAGHKRIVGRAFFNQLDSVNAQVEIRIGATTITQLVGRPADQMRMIDKEACVVLEATQALEARCSAAITTTNPNWSTSWLDYSVV